MLSLYFENHPDDENLFRLNGMGLQKYDIQFKQLGFNPKAYYTHSEVHDLSEMLWQTGVEEALNELSEDMGKKIVAVEEAAILSMFRALLVGDEGSFEKWKKRLGEKG